MNLEIRDRSRKLRMCSALVADSPLSRSRGLMFRSKIVPILFLFPNEGIWPIHSLFVFFPFDAVYIGKDRRVVEILPKIGSWKLLIVPRKKAQFLLELPEGQSKGISIGNELEWDGEEVK